MVRWLPKLLPTSSSSLSPNTSNPWSPQPTLLASSWSLPSLAHPPYPSLPSLTLGLFHPLPVHISETLLNNPFCSQTHNKHVFESLLCMKKSNYQKSTCSLLLLELLQVHTLLVQLLQLLHLQTCPWGSSILMSG